MKKTIIMLMIAAFACLPLLPVSAQRHRGYDPSRTPMKHEMPRGNPLLVIAWDRVLEIADDVNLSAEQIQAIERARNVLKETHESVSQELQTLRATLQDVMIQTDPKYLQTALEISENIHALKGQLQQYRIRAEFEVKETLTPEQQNKIRELIREHRRERARERFENRQEHKKEHAAGRSKEHRGRQE